MSYNSLMICLVVVCGRGLALSDGVSTFVNTGNSTAASNPSDEPVTKLTAVEDSLGDAGLDRGKGTVSNSTSGQTSNTSASVCRLEPNHPNCLDEFVDDGEQSFQNALNEPMIDTIQPYLNLVLWPIVILFGCICNPFNIFIFTRQNMRNPFNTYLLALSLSDLSFLFVAVVRWVMWLLSWIDTDLYQRTILSFNYRVVDNLLNLGTGRLSNMLVLVLSVERFVAVKFPLKAKLSILHRHPWKVILVTFLFVFGILIPNQLDKEWVVKFDPRTNTSKAVYQHTKFGLENSGFYKPYVFMILFVLRFVPVFFVIVFNMAIIITLAVYRKSNIISQSTNQNSREQLKMTRILIALALLFLISVSPGFVHSVVSNFHPEYKSGKKYHSIWNLFYALFTILDAFNATFNFFVYLLMSQHFRSTFMKHFCSRDPDLELKHEDVSKTTETENGHI